MSATYAPELYETFHFLYKNAIKLKTKDGKTIYCMTGTQQGCALSNLAFALLARFLEKRLEHRGLSINMYFWDDTALVETPAALKAAMEEILNFRALTGLQPRWDKCHAYAPSKAAFNALRTALKPFGTPKLTKHSKST